VVPALITELSFLVLSVGRSLVCELPGNAGWVKLVGAKLGGCQGAGSRE
jgi:hypothetical protein